MDAFFDEFKDGGRLYGDDFDQEGIEAWFADEEEGYAGLVQTGSAKYEYHYHGLNRAIGYCRLGDRRFTHAMGFGAAYGDEFQPIADRVDHITVVDPSNSFERETVCGVPSTFVQPAPSGVLPFANGQFDLVTCFGVLHHIPNVTNVLREIERCLQPGGVFLVREPMVSMGDWSKNRPGLTRRERGLPRDWFYQSVRECGFSCDVAAEFGFRPLAIAWQKLFRKSLYTSRLGTTVDRMFSRLFRWNYRYHAETALHRFRPTSVYMVLKKDGVQNEMSRAA